MYVLGPPDMTATFTGCENPMTSWAIFGEVVDAQDIPNGEFNDV